MNYIMLDGFFQNKKCIISKKRDDTGNTLRKISVQYASISKSGKMIIFRCKISIFFLNFALNHIV